MFVYQTIFIMLDPFVQALVSAELISESDSQYLTVEKLFKRAAFAYCTLAEECLHSKQYRNSLQFSRNSLHCLGTLHCTYTHTYMHPTHPCVHPNISKHIPTSFKQAATVFILLPANFIALPYMVTNLTTGIKIQYYLKK